VAADITSATVLRVPLSGFIQPCLPSRAERSPSDPGWVHEIKHDGFRMMVRRDAAGVRLLTRRGNNWTQRYPLIAAAVEALRVRSCLIDGEAVACGETGCRHSIVSAIGAPTPASSCSPSTCLSLMGETCGASR
jgi:ATP-dependent DNA ligase